MKKMTKKLFFLISLLVMPLFTCASAPDKSPNTLVGSLLGALPSAHDVCAVVFGQAVAPEEIQRYFDKAHSAFFAPADCAKQPIKLIYSASPLNELSSFTFYGTWVNENAWKNLSENEKIWYAYHETAHKKLEHAKKTTLTVIIPAALVRIVTKSKLIIALAATIPAITMSRQYEVEADRLAAEMLCKENTGVDIVREILNMYGSTAQQSTELLFFPSHAERKACLETVLEKTNKKE